ncbi:hypothetical protein KC315_g4323 [Hortaea werneckii]|nr:hypothetical protein KC315_g4323 [Hortaea werneckii]
MLRGPVLPGTPERAAATGAAPTPEQQQYLQYIFLPAVHQSPEGQRAREDHAVIVLFARKEAALGQFEGNGDDAFPIDPAFAATRAAVAANTNTFGFSTPEDDITNQQKSTSGTESRSVNPLRRRCLFEFRLCRRPFSTYRHTQATATATASAFSSLITTGNSFHDGFGDGSDSQKHGPFARANKTQGHEGDWWTWVNVDTALETHTFIRTVLS